MCGHKSTVLFAYIRRSFHRSWIPKFETWFCVSVWSTFVLKSCYRGNNWQKACEIRAQRGMTSHTFNRNWPLICIDRVQINSKIALRCRVGGRRKWIDSVRSFDTSIWMSHRFHSSGLGWRRAFLLSRPGHDHNIFFYMWSGYVEVSLFHFAVWYNFYTL